MEELVMIAIIVKDNTIIGIRLANPKTKSIVDTTIESIINNIKQGRKIFNLKLRDNSIVEYEGNSLFDYTLIDYKNRKPVGNTKYIIYYTNNELVLLDYKGKCTNINRETLAGILQSHLIVNKTYGKNLIYELDSKISKWYTPIISTENRFKKVQIGNMRVGNTVEGNKNKAILYMASYNKKTKPVFTTDKLSEDITFTRMSDIGTTEFMIFSLGGFSSFVISGEHNNESVIMHTAYSNYWLNDLNYEVFTGFNTQDIIWVDNRYCFKSYDLLYNPNMCQQRANNLMAEMRKYSDRDYFTKNKFSEYGLKILMIAMNKVKYKGVIVTIAKFDSDIRLWKIKTLKLDTDQSLRLQLIAQAGKFYINEEYLDIIDNVENTYNINKDFFCCTENIVDIEDTFKYCPRLRYDIKMLKKQCVNVIEESTIAILNDSALDKVIEINGIYVYSIIYNSSYISIVTKLSPDKIRQLNGKCLIEGNFLIGSFEDYLGNTADKIMLSYAKNKSYKTFIGHINSVIALSDTYLLSADETEVTMSKNTGLAIKHIGVTAYSIVFPDTHICEQCKMYNGSVENYLKQIITNIKLDLTKNEMYVYLHNYKITYNLDLLLEFIEKTNSEFEIKGKLIEQARDLSSIIQDIQISSDGYMLLTNKTDFNRNFAEGIFKLNPGIVGIKIRYGDFIVNTMYFDRKLDIQFINNGSIRINKAIINPGGESMLGKLFDENIDIECNYIKVDEKCKFKAADYKMILNNILKQAKNNYCRAIGKRYKVKGGSQYRNIVTNVSEYTTGIIDEIIEIRNNTNFRIQEHDLERVLKGILNKTDLDKCEASRHSSKKVGKVYVNGYNYYTEYAWLCIMVSVIFGAPKYILKEMNKYELREFNREEIEECLDSYM